MFREGLFLYNKKKYNRDFSITLLKAQFSLRAVVKKILSTVHVKSHSDCKSSKKYQYHNTSRTHTHTKKRVSLFITPEHLKLMLADSPGAMARMLFLDSTSTQLCTLPGVTLNTSISLRHPA